MTEVVTCPNCNANINAANISSDGVICEYCRSRVYPEGISRHPINDRHTSAAPQLTVSGPPRPLTPFQQQLAGKYKKWNRLFVTALIVEAVITVLALTMFFTVSEDAGGYTMLILLFALFPASLVLGCNIPDNYKTGKRRNKLLAVILIFIIFLADFFAAMFLAAVILTAVGVD